VKVDVKIIITIASLLVPLVGFYYTTNMRLDALEASVTSVQKQIKQLKKNKERRKK
jgi:Cu/Ag efflux pump CusA